MIFKKGLTEGAIGGHGPIKYSIKKYIPGNLIEFKFLKPDGFLGIHKFEIIEIEKEKTVLKHTIKMTVSGEGIFTWYIAIKWLHDALLEDCLDKAENHFLPNKKKTKWNLWVIFLEDFLEKRIKTYEWRLFYGKSHNITIHKDVQGRTALAQAFFQS